MADHSYRELPTFAYTFCTQHTRDCIEKSNARHPVMFKRGIAKVFLRETIDFFELLRFFFTGATQTFFETIETIETV